jgi:putative flippase GtrA
VTPSADPTTADRAASVKREVSSAARAGVSSIVATLTDGAFYELVLFATMTRGEAARGPYAAAAATGALAGAIANFTLNRFWAFRSKDKALVKQAAQYAAGSLMTLLVLEAVLWIIVERLGADARVAWLPAKLFTWAAFSYPFQRIVVFTRAPR